jgi:ribosomal protein S27AE
MKLAKKQQGARGVRNWKLISKLLRTQTKIWQCAEKAGIKYAIKGKNVVSYYCLTATENVFEVLVKGKGKPLNKFLDLLNKNRITKDYLGKEPWYMGAVRSYTLRDEETGICVIIDNFGFSSETRYRKDLPFYDWAIKNAASENGPRFVKPEYLAATIFRHYVYKRAPEERDILIKLLESYYDVMDKKFLSAYLVKDCPLCSFNLFLRDHKLGSKLGKPMHTLPKKLPVGKKNI